MSVHDAATGTAREFAEQILLAMHRAGVSATTFDDGQFGLRNADDHEMVLNLAPIYGDWRTWPGRERAARLDRFVTSMAHPPERPADWEHVAGSLRPVLRSASLRHGDVSPLSRPALPCLREYVVIDTPTTMAYVTSDHLDTWGVAEDRVFVTARTNLAGLPDPTVGVDGPGVHQLTDDGDQYVTSRLLLDGSLGRLQEVFGRPPVVFVPDRQTLIIAPDDEATLPDLLDAVGDTYQQASRPLSPQPYTVDPATGATVPYPVRPGSPAAAAVHRATWLLAGSEYQEQKAWLDETHERDGIDVFVASVMLRQTPTGELSSLSVLGEDVDSLLPRTDQIAFASEGDTFIVRWDDVAGVLGLTPEPDLDPPRYRVRRWPAPAQLERLRALAVDP